MTSLFEQLPHLAAYHYSFLVLAGLALVNLIQSFLIAPLSFISEEQAPGMPLQHDHSRLSFRVQRTYGNSTETLPAFGWALFVAIIAGTLPVLVNGLAIGYFVFRLLFWWIYYAGIGKVAGGPRTLSFVGGVLCNSALAIAAIWTLLS